MEAGEGPRAADVMMRAVLDYVARGWRVFPLHAPLRSGGCSCTRPDCPAVGKHPRTKNGLKDATADPAIIGDWWRRWPFANIGVVTGAVSGLLVLDVDVRHGGATNLIALLRQAGAELPETLDAATGGGGEHFVFSHPGPDHLLRNVQRLAGLDGLDVRGDGGYIVAPPSLHASGQRYRWIDPDAPILPAPDWLVRLLSRPRNEARDRGAGGATGKRASPSEEGAHWLDKALERAAPGTRNDTGFWLACQLRDAGLSQGDAEAVLMAYAERVPAGENAYTLGEAMGSARSAYAAGARQRARKRGTGYTSERGDTSEDAADPDTEPGEDGAASEQPPPAQAPPLPMHQTDLGNARRFTGRHGANVRHVAAWGQWLIWDGSRWRRDDTGHAMRLAKDTVAALYATAAECEDEDERRELAKWAMRSEAEARLRAMIALAESEHHVAIAADRLDANGWLLNCRNGMVDLRTGALLPHDRAALCSKRTAVDYDPRATCPAWDTFLRRIFAEDEELIAYARRAVGYALTCETGEQCVFVLHGSGANGKSTFLETLCKLLGDYAMTTPTDTLMVKQGQTIPSDVARLVGARLVAASESGDGRRLDEELVKRISGGDRMSARFMHHDWFEFYPVLKLFLAVNHKPTIRGTDNGIWRRIRLIPFGVTIPPEQQDRQLARKLLAEAPGILAWAVRGALEWQRGGLQTPKSVQDATAGYRSEMDAIGRFIEERCTQGDNLNVAAKALYAAYVAWCGENGERELSQTRFGVSLAERGYDKVHTDRGNVWLGLDIAPTV